MNNNLKNKLIIFEYLLFDYTINYLYKYRINNYL